jgi:hypothetical protein
MAIMEHVVEIRTGRRDGDGHVRVSVFMDDLPALAIEGHGERAPTLLLTVEQARRLRDALGELIELTENAEGERQKTAAWQGEERRRRAS